MAGGFGSKGDSGSGSAYPVTYGFGLVVLLALGVLVALRYFYGAIHIEGGVK